MQMFFDLFMTFFKIENRPGWTFFIRGFVGGIGIFILSILESSKPIDFYEPFFYIGMLICFLGSFFIIGVITILDWYKRKEELELERQEEMKKKNKVEDL